MRRTALALSLTAGTLGALPAAAVDISGPSFHVEGFEVEGNNPLSQPETHAVLDLYLGEHDGIKGLKAAADALNQRLAEKGFPTRRVILPAQGISAGVVTLQVVSFTIGDVSVEGNEHYSSENILASVPALQPGTDPAGDVLSTQLALANEHPTKSVQLLFAEGTGPRQIDATVKVEDERPYNLFAIINNRGSANTKPTRLVLGAQHSNLFDMDHVLTATYATSPQDFSAVKQYGVNYRVPLYHFNAVLSAYFVKSDVDSGVVAGVFNVSDAGRFLGVRYRQHLQRLGSYSHSLTAGLDDKLFESRVSFGATNIPTDVRSRPLSLRYDGEYRFSQGRTRFYTAYARNVPIGANNTAAAYASARANAVQDWDVVRFGGGFEHALPRGFGVQGRLDAQIGGEPLIPGEQFGVGGVGSVRGYDERLVAGDDGYAASVEIWSPALAYGIRGLGFFDLGFRNNRQALAGENASDNLSSVGVGLRWAWQRWLSVSADVALPLQPVRAVKRGDVHAHLELVLRY